MMDNRAHVSLTIRYGAYGEKHKTVILPISEDLVVELMEPVELSDDPFSILVASPGLFGGKGDALTIRHKAFKMRKSVAESIARAMIPALLEAFGVNDELDGYRVSDMTEEEREYQKSRGRLREQP